MKQAVVIVLLVASICFLSMSRSGKDKNLAPAVASINHLYLQNIRSLDSFMADYPNYFYDSSYSLREKKYEELAYYFKRAAGIMICLQPDLYYKKLVRPFQFEKTTRPGFFSFVPDPWLFFGPIGNEPDSVLKTFRPGDTTEQVVFIKETIARYRRAIGEINTSIRLDSQEPAQVFNTLRTEIFRISAIDVANSDFIIDEAGLPSLNGSTESWLQYANELFMQLPASGQVLQSRWNRLSAQTRQYLQENTGYKSFNRMYFVRNCLIPLSQALGELQVALHVPLTKQWSAVRAGATHLYDKNIFNADFFAPGKDAYYSAAKANLGELLFFDPILSDNNRRACASCHKPRMAFTDGQVKATSFERDDLPRNSPTVINAGFQKKNFWDMRAGSLEDQLDSVINNPNELHSSFDRVIDRINSSPEYLALFYKSFPATKKTGVTREAVKNAIGVYERTVTGLDSRFDRYMQGDNSQLSPHEINGFNVYMGKGKCGSCHFAPLFNGALPPFYELTDHHSLGVPVKDSMEKYVLDTDSGVYKITGDSFTRFSFKTPSVRNIALTAPYMHNGVYKTLEQVVNFYDHAAGAKFQGDYGKQLKGLPFFTILPVELKLTPEEKTDLVAFLGALTDTSAAHTPKRLPVLTGKYASSNKRIIGGVY
ncbi:MAG: cytochrome c peroxidase [Chitinophagaceae bacterium]